MENKSFIKEFISEVFVHGDSTAFSVYDGENLTDISYAQFIEDVFAVSGYFARNKISNQHIALIAPNSYKWIVTFFAVLATGNIAVLLNSDLPADMMKQFCHQADVSMIWSDSPDIVTSMSDLGNVQWICTDDFSSADPIKFEDISERDIDETLILVGTSGTSGKTKIVEITAQNLKCSIENNPPAKKLVGTEKQLLVLPLYHISGVITTTLSLFRGKTLCIGRGMRHIFLDLPVFRPTFITLVPSMMESLEKIYRLATTEEARVKRIGGNLKRLCVAGAASKRSTCQYLIDQGLILETGYGMTESAGDGTWCEFTAENIGTIGKSRGSMCCQIQDGEIVFKSGSVMKGYYKDPEETAKVIVDGWLHTGDMGCCDENGYYYITGRKKNVIILSNGENVNPEEIEAKFNECEAIEECLVYSDGKGICADVFAKDQNAANEFIKSYNENVPMYRQVYKVSYLLEPLPKTGSGKIKRKENV